MLTAYKWLKSTDHYEKGIILNDDDIEKFNKSIDCYVMGSRTYEHALQLGWPYGDVPVFVLTSRALVAEKQSVEFYNGVLGDFFNNDLKPVHQNIWVIGGSMVTKECLRARVATEIIVSIMPVILGEGKLFFDFIGLEQQLHLQDVTTYKDGMVELRYELV